LVHERGEHVLHGLRGVSARRHVLHHSHLHACSRHDGLLFGHTFRARCICDAVLVPILKDALLDARHAAGCWSASRADLSHGALPAQRSPRPLLIPPRPARRTRGACRSVAEHPYRTKLARHSACMLLESALGTRCAGLPRLPVRPRRAISARVRPQAARFFAALAHCARR
jgi:hypothetical protein